MRIDILSARSFDECIKCFEDQDAHPEEFQPKFGDFSGSDLQNSYREIALLKALSFTLDPAEIKKVISLAEERKMDRIMKVAREKLKSIPAEADKQ